MNSDWNLTEQLSNDPFIIRLKTKTASLEEYAELLKVYYSIFSTIEGSFKSDITSVKVTDSILDDLTELGVIYINSELDSVKKYCLFLRGQDYRRVVPHIHLNYITLITLASLLKGKAPLTARTFNIDNHIVKKIMEGTVYQTDWVSEYDVSLTYLKDILNELITYTKTHYG